MRLWFQILTVSVLLTSAAEAQTWSTTTEDDIFSGGKTAIMLAIAGRNDAVYFNCGPDGDIQFSVVFKFGGEIQTGIPSEILIKVDDAEARRFPAQTYQHNDEHGGFIVPAGEDLQPLLSELKEARGQILVGTNIVGRDARNSFSVSSNGSTRAVETLQSACAR